MTQRNQAQKQQPLFQQFLTREERNGNNISRAFHALEEEIVSDSFDGSFYCAEEESPMLSNQYTQNLRVSVATWNVGGKYPHNGLNLDDFLQVNNQADIFVLGFQEIVPLNAGNWLVMEDNQPAASWLALINNLLNKSHDTASRGRKNDPTYGGLFFSKPSLKKISKTFGTEKGRKLKSCNCSLELERKASKDLCFRCQDSYINEDGTSSEEEDEIPQISLVPDGKQIKYSLIASKQMVGIFVSVWMRKELVQHVGHLRISCISRGIMGCLGNKGCISVSFSFFQTSLCFICSHLASGEKEGDELRRNLDVMEILKNTQFSRICRTLYSKMPERILDHDRIIWIGDLNYRIALSYSDTTMLLQQNAWDALLEKDQLKIEREAGRVFSGWKEGKIYFPPTYKYFLNSDTYYADEIKNSKIKRRTPAWCDRILWHGNGIRQLCYVRGESKFSDHRPVCAEFLVEVEVPSGRLRNNYNTKVGIE